jgi:hypothetical protein
MLNKNVLVSENSVGNLANTSRSMRLFSRKSCSSSTVYSACGKLFHCSLNEKQVCAPRMDQKLMLNKNKNVFVGDNSVGNLANIPHSMRLFSHKSCSSST